MLSLLALTFLFLGASVAQSDSETYNTYEDGTLGGFSNGLRYIFRLTNYYGSSGTKTDTSYCPDWAYNNGVLPSYNGSTTASYYRDFRLCFYRRDTNYIYSTACGQDGGWIEQFIWAGNNFSLPYSVGSGSGASGTYTASSSLRYVSYDASTRYDYYPDSGTTSGARYHNFQNGYINSQYTVLTLSADGTRVEKYTAFTEYCVYEYTAYAVVSSDSGRTASTSGVKTFNAFPYVTSMFSTQVLTGVTTNHYQCNSARGSYSYGTSLQNNADRSVCINDCAATAQFNTIGWTAIPHYVCVVSDEFNTYTLTDCLGKNLATFRHTWGGYYDDNTDLSNNPYKPYSFITSSGGLKVVAYSNYSTATINTFQTAYRLEGANPQSGCSGTWSAPMTPIADYSVSPPFAPAVGIYNFYSNIAVTGLNSWHFANLGGSGSVGSDYSNYYPARAWGTSGTASTDSWYNYCYGALYNGTGGIRPKSTDMPMTVCLVQSGDNSWTFNDCDGETTYATFGWNGMEWAGWEGANPITVTFTGSNVKSYTFTHPNGMCLGTFEVRKFVPNSPSFITNGRYSRTAATAGYNFGYNVYRYSDYNWPSGSGSYNPSAFQSCSAYPAPVSNDNVCVYNLGSSVAAFDCDTATPISLWGWNGLQWEQSAPWGIDAVNRNYEYLTSVSSTGFSVVTVRGGCYWWNNYTYTPSIAHVGPATLKRGHYSASGSTSYEGVCYADPAYNDVQIHPEGLLGLIVRDGSSGEILLRLNWDRSLWVGRDELRGSFIYATSAADGTISLHGSDGSCGWTIAYSIAPDVVPLPPINPSAQSDPPHDGFGVYNGEVVTDSISSCNDDTLTSPVDKFETVCVFPNGPASLVITQCSDDRQERFTTIMEVWWDGAAQQWVGSDDTYWYTFETVKHDDGDIVSNRFLITATSDTSCTYQISLWRGDDCYTAGWKAGIVTFALLFFFTFVILVFLLVNGGAAGSSSGDYQTFG